MKDIKQILNEEESNAEVFAQGWADEFNMKVLSRLPYWKKYTKFKRVRNGFQYTLKTADGKTVIATFEVKE